LLLPRPDPSQPPPPPIHPRAPPHPPSAARPPSPVPQPSPPRPSLPAGRTPTTPSPFQAALSCLARATSATTATNVIPPLPYPSHTACLGSRSTLQTSAL